MLHHLPRLGGGGGGGCGTIPSPLFPPSLEGGLGFGGGGGLSAIGDHGFDYLPFLGGGGGGGGGGGT